VGTPFVALVHPDQRPAITAIVNGESIEAGETVPVRFALWTREGTWRSMEGSITDLTRDRSVSGLVVNVHDVTERDVAAEELAAARDKAMEASRMKSQFLASMSHEIRTPMNAVIGLSQLLLDTSLTSEQREYTQGVTRAGEGLLTIIDEILDFSKVEAGRVQLEHVGFDLIELVDEVATLLGDVANGKGVELLAHCATDLPSGVRGDPTRLRQILVNLTSNAVKFTEVGEVLIRVQPSAPAERRDDVDLMRIRFDVRDTGIGISEPAQEHIFDPFSQADASTTRRFGGTGLGLAIVKQLVELMGGHVAVESRQGVGSTFSFVIPLELVSRPQSITPVATLSGLHALVVDDNATNRLILTEQLRSWGMRAEEAEDGPTAIIRARYMAVRGDAFDVAVLDLNMPELDGLDVARILHDDPSTAGARLFLLSSSGQVKTDVATAAGLSGSLTKPVRKSDLYNCLVEGFSTEIPVLPPEVVSASPAASAVNDATRGSVMLVEDNATNRLVACRIVEKLGYAVDVAENGRVAIDMLTASIASDTPIRYAVIFMDCQMPVMDGYEATRAIRALEGLASHTPIIAMTAAAMDGDREACIAAGMDDYLAKPIRPELVRAALARWAPDTISPSDEESTPPADDVIDLARLELLMRLDRGGADLINEVLHQYIDDTTTRLSSLRDALAREEMASVSEFAHTMRGASANVGAPIMGALCARVEDLARRGDVEGCKALVTVVEGEFERVRRALLLALESATGGPPR
jgi:two-component system, sensor histidine kinase and response regulator